MTRIMIKINQQMQMTIRMIIIIFIRVKLKFKMISLFKVYSNNSNQDNLTFFKNNSNKIYKIKNII